MPNIQIHLSPALCYGSISLFTTVLHNVYLLYHISMFVTVFKIDKTSFWIGETIFLVWNSVNDPLFGWFSDSKAVKGFESELDNSSGQLGKTSAVHNAQNGSYFHNTKELGASPSVIINRTKAIAFYGPLMALSFTVFWFNWDMPCIQFSVCLCLYDSFLTMVELHQSALLADLSLSTEQRAAMNTYESIFSAVGSLSVFLSYQFWDKNDPFNFQIFCLLLAAFSVAGFYTAAVLLRVSFIRIHNLSNIRLESNVRVEKTPPVSQKKSLKAFIKQLMAHKNFLVFTLINVVQVSNMR